MIPRCLPSTTGIRKLRGRARKRAWIERALNAAAASSNGHCRPSSLAGGDDTTGDEGESADIYQLLAKHGVSDLVMAVTHHSEYYREKMTGDGAGRTTHHFCQRRRRGLPEHRHGSRLSEATCRQRLAFYPSTDRLRSKIALETPLWKRPFWYWITWLKRWPFNVEASSGIFDFNPRRSSRASRKCVSNGRGSVW